MDGKFGYIAQGHFQISRIFLFDGLIVLRVDVLVVEQGIIIAEEELSFISSRKWIPHIRSLPDDRYSRCIFCRK